MMPIITLLTLVSAVRISTDSRLMEKCGCLFKSKLSADCSSRENIDFKCLSEMKPDEILLRNNNYTEVPKEIFEHEFNETRHIDFSENSIEHLPANLSDHFVGCQSANFSFNNLTDLSEVLLINPKVKLSILGNHFECDCNDPNNIQAHRHAKKLGATLTCYSPVYERDIPLSSKCHIQFNSEPPEEEGHKRNIEIVAWGAFFALIVLLAFCLSQRARSISLSSQENEDS